MNWYYATASDRNGPVSEEELTTLLNNGTVLADTLVWQDGMPDWQPLSRVRPDLASGTAAGVSVPVVAGYALTGHEKDLAVQRMREGYAGGNAAVEYAGFWVRLLAKFIDYLALWVVFIPLFMVFGFLMPSLDKNGAAGVFATVLLFLIQAATPFLYYGIMVGKYGATLGKMALGLKVVRDDMLPVSMGRAFGRAAGEWISGMVMGIGYLMVAFDLEKRALHDHIASTRVIRTR